MSESPPESPRPPSFSMTEDDFNDDDVVMDSAPMTPPPPPPPGTPYEGIEKKDVPSIFVIQ